MTVRNFSLYCGLLFLALGLAGFIPPLLSEPPTQPNGLVIDGGYGYLFGLFPTNWVHNLVHIIVGILGISAARDSQTAMTYTRGFTIVYSLITAMGIMPALGTTFGLMPIFGGNVILNLTATIAAAYYGFIAPNPEVTLGSNAGSR